MGKLGRYAILTPSACSRKRYNPRATMRRFLAIVLLLFLVVGSVPSFGQVRLICRMTGVEMKPVAVKESPKSCCAVRQSASGTFELANRSCCELRFTPGHPPLPDAELPLAPGFDASLPTLALRVPLPALDEKIFCSVPIDQPRYRGPPGSLASARAPPAFF